MRTIEYQNLKWIDILRPTEEELKFLEERFSVHPIILEEIRTPTNHPLAELYKTYLFFILHFPELQPETHRIRGLEVDYVITQDTLITIRYEDFADFETLWSVVEQNPTKYLKETTGFLFYRLMKYLLDRTFPELDQIREEIRQSEEQIFQAFDEDIIGRIASIKRQILNFIQAVKPQRSVWESIRGHALEFWGDKIKPHFSDLVADYNRTLNLIETYREIIDSLHLTSSSLLDHKRNYVVKVLTVFTAIILPLSLLTSIYGMNIAHLPLADRPEMFWWFIIAMAVVTIGLLLYFRRKRWL
ncbi:magnesium transporter CorA family protein [Candidatus Jorgensenbacteria bacterium]|nr:magnesium transporter CorA family protein [Candidatus Jorgensenbacteria bacterium]